jgi:hypothetical protein
MNTFSTYFSLGSRKSISVHYYIYHRNEPATVVYHVNDGQHAPTNKIYDVNDAQHAPAGKTDDPLFIFNF